ncbi:MAG: type I-E CRISPR-associated protein Cas5/CasD [Pseudomonadota bacterium]
MTGQAPRRWLALRFEAPLIAFGGVTIDHIGKTRDFPSLSMMTGLFANALGWDRTQREQHQHLQDRLIFGARIDHDNRSGVLRDQQNADLSREKSGWTSRGQPEKRAGGSLDQAHRRVRDYHPDADVVVVAHLSEADVPPTLDDIRNAIDKPARPLFIGRKPCLPTAPLVQLLANGTPFVTAVDVFSALAQVPQSGFAVHQGDNNLGDVRRATWPLGEGPHEGYNVTRVLDLADRRNWISGLHGGTRPVVEGRIRLQAADGAAA